MMMMTLQRYNLTIQYVRGKDNVVADTLSRAPIDEKNSETYNNNLIYSIKLKDEKIMKHFSKINLINYLSISDERIQDIIDATTRDVSMQNLKKLIVDGWEILFAMYQKNYNFITNIKMNLLHLRD